MLNYQRVITKTNCSKKPSNPMSPVESSRLPCVCNLRMCISYPHIYIHIAPVWCAQVAASSGHLFLRKRPSFAAGALAGLFFGGVTRDGVIKERQVDILYSLGMFGFSMSDLGVSHVTKRWLVVIYGNFVWWGKFIPKKSWDYIV